MSLRQQIQQILKQEDINFLLTNRLPRRWLTQFTGWFSKIEHPWVRNFSIAMWKYFYPRDPKIDLLWRVVANKNRGAPFTGPFHLIEPLLFANDALCALTGDRGAGAVLQGAPTLPLSAHAALDVDRANDLASARTLIASPDV